MAHWSSCPVHNEPALPAGPCNCGDDAPETEEDPTLQQVKQILESIFDRMDDVGAVVHPWVIEDFFALAKLVGVSSDRVPTEGRALMGMKPGKRG